MAREEIGGDETRKCTLGPPYMVKSHEMDSLGDCVCNSGGHIITYYKKYF